jgi:hypothetical protein
MLQQSELDWLAAERPTPIDLDPATTERVRSELVTYATQEPTRHSRLLSRVPRLRLRHGAYAAAAAAIAFVALLAVGVSSGHRHAESLGGLGVQSAAAAPLVHLSAKLAAAPAPVGDATLVIRQQTNEHDASTVTELFTDDGYFYATPSLAELSTATRAKETIGEGESDAEVRDIAAAKAALSGPIAAARHQMSIAALDPGIHPKTITPDAADLAKIKGAEQAPGYSPPSALEKENNEIWMNSMDALIAGAGDPQVRAGVLALLATIPQITTTQGTLEGQPTMVLNYISTPTGGEHEQLIINSSTGVPIEQVGWLGSQQAPSTSTHYKISRVTVTEIENESH